MLSWLFFSFLAVALILTIAGFVLDISILNLTGTIFIFLLGITLLTTGLSYKSGEEIYYQYGNNFTYPNGTATYHWDYDASGIPPTADNGVFLFHTNAEDIYSNYDDASENRFGWFLLTLGSLGFILSMFKL